MRIVTVSVSARLVPIAQRLRLEGHTVELHFTREHWRAAYRGIFDPQPSQDWQQAVEGGEALLLTDDITVSDQFQHAPLVLGRLPSDRERSPLGVQGWWDGQQLVAPHWSVVEVGALAGGTGRRVPSSVTLAAMPSEATPLDPATEAVRTAAPAGFRGVVRVEVVDALKGELGVVRLGWPDLSYSLWAAGQDSTTDLIEGKPKPPRGVEFGTVLSVPPWPNPPTRASRPLPVADLPPEARRSLVWHDVELHRGKLRTAGLDGFVALGVARARLPRTARHRVFQVAGLLGLEELQVRQDAGDLGELVLVGLEEAGMLSTAM